MKKIAFFIFAFSVSIQLYGGCFGREGFWNDAKATISASPQEIEKLAARTYYQWLILEEFPSATKIESINLKGNLVEKK